MNISFLIESIRSGKVRITKHARDEAWNDGLMFDEVYGSVFCGEVILNYPDDRPYPSCLVFGKNFMGEPIHSVWAYNPETFWAVLITVYRPDPDLWINWKERKR